ncbi:sugar ABC transporter substrate-binding protein [Nocardioides mangrovicus]|uniref:Sugar ABC transporter substrate-binding protein n=1 Tax=Nocardioides mangrovicus TaxID=2478913 RepID=A0A3L8NYN2_9ACTN|nr:sugar ABC transporter substrate-binding protein [Nocardioides mangrovicus]RLV47767.1 sugar ABC transporter substrate-binding protein [Nocardioides mangrovicus]
MGLSRRAVLAGAGAAGLSAGSAAGLAGCGFAPSSSDSAKDTLRFTTWGTDAELAGFRTTIAAFEKAHGGARVELNAVPYEQMFTNIDAQLQAGNPPDVFRVPYYTFGAYAGRGQLLDLSSHLPSGFSDRFTPQAWAAVQRKAKPYGVPHHTDTSVLLYNKKALADVGVTDVPTRADQAWTWQQLEQVLRKLRTALPASQYPLAVNWQGNGVTRWLSWLFQADGRFLSADLSQPAIQSAAGTAAVDFTRALFPDKLVPPNNSVKSTTLAADLWYGGTVPLSFGGAFQLPDADSAVDFEWGASPAPRDVRGGGDFGGNALVATAKTKRPGLAASFLAHVTGEDQMRAFCERASLLPTRRDLVAKGIRFQVRPDLSRVFLGQAGVVRASDSGQVASPSMSGIISVLQDQLEQTFVGDQATAAALSGMTSGIAKALAA